jgi:hypothetical protein
MVALRTVDPHWYNTCVVRWQKGKHTDSDPSLTKLQGRGKKKKKKGKGQRARRNPDRLPWGAAEIQSEARR